MDLGFQEIVLIVVIALLVYGGELPGVMRSLGRTVGSIKRALQEGTRDVTEKLDVRMDIAPDEDLPRLVRRAPNLAIDAPAPHDVATEDVSGTTVADVADVPPTVTEPSATSASGPTGTATSEPAAAPNSTSAAAPTLPSAAAPKPD